MIARTVADRGDPLRVALVEIDRGDAAVRRLQQRQAVERRRHHACRRARTAGCCAPAFGFTSCTTIGLVIDGTYSVPVSGSNDAPAQFAPPAHPGFTIVPFSDGGVKIGPVSNCLNDFERRVPSAPA